MAAKRKLSTLIYERIRLLGPDQLEEFERLSKLLNATRKQEDKHYQIRKLKKQAKTERIISNPGIKQE